MLNRLSGLRREPTRASAAAVLPLRLFLGGTFVYAALDKLTDPAFFDATAPTYIGQQFAGYVRTGSPHRCLRQRASEAGLPLSRIDLRSAPRGAGSGRRRPATAFGGAGTGGRAGQCLRR
jgi:hypothetical protein